MPPTPLVSQACNNLSALTIRDNRPPSLRELADHLKVNFVTLSHRLSRGMELGLITGYYDGRGRMHYIPNWWKVMVAENIEKYSRVEVG